MGNIRLTFGGGGEASICVHVSIDPPFLCVTGFGLG